MIETAKSILSFLLSDTVDSVLDSHHSSTCLFSFLNWSSGNARIINHINPIAFTPPLVLFEEIHGRADRGAPGNFERKAYSEIWQFQALSLDPDQASEIGQRIRDLFIHRRNSIPNNGFLFKDISLHESKVSYDPSSKSYKNLLRYHIRVIRSS